MSNNRIEELKSEITYVVNHFSKCRNHRMEMSFSEYLLMQKFLSSFSEGRKYIIVEGFSVPGSLERPYFIKKK